MIVDILRTWIGIPPIGLEFLEYAGALAVFLILFQFVADIFRTWSKFLGGR